MDEIALRNTTGRGVISKNKLSVYNVEDINDLQKIKMSIIRTISKLIEKNNWSQSYTARLLEVDQPKISQIKHCRTDGFSLERLIRFLILLGFKISFKAELPEE
ncbi:XRE family transcriptional regulator [Anaplasmataceae bacterium AB001_6]|nr:XRE family transcriptional regulator [Anaplasmataceae bacterium AB001_6]